jgi:hypothetical protein
MSTLHVDLFAGAVLSWMLVDPGPIACSPHDRRCVRAVRSAGRPEAGPHRQYVIANRLGTVAQGPIAMRLTQIRIRQRCAPDLENRRRHPDRTGT